MSGRSWAARKVLTGVKVRGTPSMSSCIGSLPARCGLQAIVATIVLPCRSLLRSHCTNQRRNALHRSGNISRLCETVRDQSGPAFVEEFERDIAYAIRMLRQNRGWSAEH